MEDDTWSFAFSASPRSYQSTLKSQSDLCIDFEEIEEDDELMTEYPCPYCSEGFDLLGLCCHIDEEHHLDAGYGELHDAHYQSHLFRSWSSLSSSTTGPDPLLSFLHTAPPADSSGSVQPASPTEVTLEEKGTNERMLEKLSPLNWMQIHDSLTLCRDVHLSPLSDKEHSEKANKWFFIFVVQRPSLTDLMQYKYLLI
ncbi:Drought-responsive family protein, putative isoform 3 [Hibiscus syriacus]|uniref:Drought-responsive family protein, putative isoform 3 n=1 Tax=Hibiscus syriacus TaxID=106335 RepID=A0A6A3A0W1_HIBSY|nr:Drought-responsive family protein, putative isoform 3 [Hibiscus syriacus]